MFIIGNQIFCIGSKSTVYKLIVIGVFGYQTKAEMWVNKGDILSI